MKKIYDIYIDGQYKRSIIASNKETAYKIAEQHYPYALDDDLLEVEERKRWENN